MSRKQQTQSEIIPVHAAGGVIFRQSPTGKEWLLVKSAEHNEWIFPKGHVADLNKKETEEEAALREVREEAGVHARIMHPTPVYARWEYPYKGKLYHKQCAYYLMEYESGNLGDHDTEIAEARFVPEEEVSFLLTHKESKEVFAKIRALL